MGTDNLDKKSIFLLGGTPAIASSISILQHRERNRVTIEEKSKMPKHDSSKLESRMQVVMDSCGVTVEEFKVMARAFSMAGIKVHESIGYLNKVFSGSQVAAEDFALVARDFPTQDEEYVVDKKQPNFVYFQNNFKNRGRGRR